MTISPYKQCRLLNDIVFDNSHGGQEFLQYIEVIFYAQMDLNAKVIKILQGFLCE
jgi:hypothetical protein